MNTRFHSFVRSAYGLLLAGSSSLSHPLLLVFRLYWGWSFFQTGWGKLMTHDQVTEFFTSLGIPLPGLNAWMAGATECFGGLLLLVGLASRLTAIPLIVTMIVAYLTADAEAVRSIFSEPDKFTGADPFLFLLAAVLVFVFGPGFFSLDRLIAWWDGRRMAVTGAPQAEGNATHNTFARPEPHSGAFVRQ